MAIWERTDILSGPKSGEQQPGMPPPGFKPVVGLCMIHTGFVTMAWATMFRHLNVGHPYTFMHSSNMPYDCSRELITREVLKQGVKWVFHLDTDVMPPPEAIPVLIKLAEENDKPFLSGLYWAKKREPFAMPAAWVKVGEDKEQNRINYQPLNVQNYLDKNALIACDVIGAGCMLVRADIFKKLDESNPNLPYFQWGLNRRDPLGKNLPQLSEDFFFCKRTIEELGIHPHLATMIKCGHICEAIKRPQDGVLELL
jgi:hypothetical protein